MPGVSFDVEICAFSSYAAWLVSMMIYGWGITYFRVCGKLIKSKAMAELQFWFANIGLVGMLGFYTLGICHQFI